MFVIFRKIYLGEAFNTMMSHFVRECQARGIWGNMCQHFLHYSRDMQTLRSPKILIHWLPCPMPCIFDIKPGCIVAGTTDSYVFVSDRVNCVQVSVLLSTRQLHLIHPPGQNGRHFADDSSRCIFVNEKFCSLITISLNFVAKGPIDNKPALI